VGDPRWSPHPVVVMGWWISRLQRLVEHRAGDRPLLLRAGGAAITLLLVVGSALAGWGIERLVQGIQTEGVGWAWIGWAMLTAALASALAGRSLAQAVGAVVAALPRTPASAEQPDARRGLAPARQRLAWIVGRDTTELTEAEILRAAAETASENAVDGQFAPLFWMLVGAGLWGIRAELPGPLALAWGFKAASTLDSMLGYRRGRLQWLGTAGARLDDLLVWLPCRLVAFSLPLVQGGPLRWWPQVQASLRDGRPDPSPNAGVSQAAYAHAAGVQLGGRNRYAEGWTEKPLLAAGLPPADAAAIERILELTSRLSLLWLAVSGVVSGVISGVAVAGLRSLGAQ
jgi:adenosylcobinamide-phosphate synthase